MKVLVTILSFLFISSSVLARESMIMGVEYITDQASLQNCNTGSQGAEFAHIGKFILQDRNGAAVVGSCDVTVDASAGGPDGTDVVSKLTIESSQKISGVVERSTGAKFFEDPCTCMKQIRELKSSVNSRRPAKLDINSKGDGTVTLEMPN